MCVWLVVLSPVIALLNNSVGQVLFEKAIWIVVGGEESIVNYVPYVANLLVRTFGVWAGLSLWSVKPEAVSLAKNFLRTDLAFGLARNMFFAAVVSSTEVSFGSFGIAEALVISATIDILFFLVWSSYLKKSSRVKRTFVSQGA